MTLRKDMFDTAKFGYFKMLVAMSLLICLSYSVIGQVMINEVCSKNNTVLTDEFGETPDWIEIYNAGENPINLLNYYLSDDPDEPQMWSFPNVIIGADEYLLILASEMDTLAENIHTNFKLSSGGDFLSLYAGELLIDTLQIPALRSDHSYGNEIDGIDDPYFFELPTPELSNVDSETYLGYVDMPIHNKEAGFHPNGDGIEIWHNEEEVHIMYSTNGEPPSPLSDDDEVFDYTGPFDLEVTTVVRSRAFKEGYLPSDINTSTYLIDENISIPVMSLSTDPYHLWDYWTGIYTAGIGDDEWPWANANFWNNWERPMHIEYFDEFQNLVLEQDCAVKIHGSSARTRPQKPFRLTAKKSYGPSSLDYPFFKQKPEITEYKNIILRNAGNDNQQAFMRDALVHDYILNDESIEFGVSAYQPCIVFLNGNYWGIYNIRERVDEHYIERQYDLDIDEFDILENNYEIISGHHDEFIDFIADIDSMDFSLDDNYALLEEKVNIPGTIDYMIVEFYLNNTDWLTNNIKYWKAKNDTAKWNYLLYDVDIAFGGGDWVVPELNFMDSLFTKEFFDNKPNPILYRGMFQNEGFRHQFINRYADLLNSFFLPDSMRQQVMKIADGIDLEMIRHRDKWGAGNYLFWVNNINDEIFNYVDERPAYARDHIEDQFELNNQYTLELEVFPPGGGKIKVNSIEATEFPWEGVYFNGVPIEITAEPYDSISFVRWETSLPDIDQLSDPNFTYDFENTIYLKAVFDGTTYVDTAISNIDEFDVIISPNITTAQSTLELKNVPKSDVQITVINQLGQEVKTYQLATNHFYHNTTTTIDVSDLPQGMYHVHIRAEDFFVSKELFKM